MGVLSTSVARAAFVTRVLHRAMAALGSGVGLPLAARDLRRAPTERSVVPPTGGPRQVIRLGRRHTDLATFVQVFADRCYEFNSVVEPRWIIDAGANVGYAASWFATTYPGSTVIAVEPDPDNFRMLLRNSEALPTVVPVWAALSDAPGEALLVDPGLGSWGMQVQRADQRWSSSPAVHRVPCVTLGQLLEDFQIDRVSLLKIDIEGGELEVLRASPSWMPRVDALVAELHDRMRPGCTRAFIEATADFPHEVVRGESFFVSRDGGAA